MGEGGEVEDQSRGKMKGDKNVLVQIYKFNAFALDKWARAGKLFRSSARRELQLRTFSKSN